METSAQARALTRIVLADFEDVKVNRATEATSPLQSVRRQVSPINRTIYSRCFIAACWRGESASMNRISEWLQRSHREPTQKRSS